MVHSIKFSFRGEDSVLQIAAAAGIGYCCARAFFIVNPIHGAVFCVVSSLVSKVTVSFFDQAFAHANTNRASRLLTCIVGTAAGIAVSTVITTKVGFPISFHEGLVLTCSIVALRILMDSVLTLIAEVS
jgi:hypothetical protein